MAAPATLRVRSVGIGTHGFRTVRTIASTAKLPWKSRVSTPMVRARALRRFHRLRRLHRPWWGPTAPHGRRTLATGSSSFTRPRRAAKRTVFCRAAATACGGPQTRRHFPAGVGRSPARAASRRRTLGPSWCAARSRALMSDRTLVVEQEAADGDHKLQARMCAIPQRQHAMLPLLVS